MGDKHPRFAKKTNTATIEVTGGNHTREAYTRLREEGYFEGQFCLPVDLYTNLSLYLSLYTNP